MENVTHLCCDDYPIAIDQINGCISHGNEALVGNIRLKPCLVFLNGGVMLGDDGIGFLLGVAPTTDVAAVAAKTALKIIMTNFLNHLNKSVCAI